MLYWLMNLGFAGGGAAAPGGGVSPPPERTLKGVGI